MNVTFQFGHCGLHFIIGNFYGKRQDAKCGQGKSTGFKGFLCYAEIQLREVTNVNQWKDTSEVIKWFNKIESKSEYKFIIFDIKDFYPSIKKKLLTDALKFAEEITNISEEDMKIIYHSRKSLLFNENQAWMKKEGELFDVTMGAYDGAEVCELIGIFMLHKLSTQYKKGDIGLYRDDGLAILKNISGSESERMKKNIQSTFKENGLEIIIECNKKIVNFLDITINLNDGTYKPYHKPDNLIQYINIESNHPPNIIKQIPKTIEKRLSINSSNEKIFKEATPVYEEALKKSGYDKKLSYTPQKQNKNNKNRKRNIIWFNPPFSNNVSTKVGKHFLTLLDVHFPPHHKFNKNFNRNSVKIISYQLHKEHKINKINHKRP